MYQVLYNATVAKNKRSPQHHKAKIKRSFQQHNIPAAGTFGAAYKIHIFPFAQSRKTEGPPTTHYSSAPGSQ